MAVLYLGTQKISPVIVTGSPSKYQLLQRIKDDSNNEIGTVSGFFTDANDNEYAVVCLDAQYRLAGGKFANQNGDVDIPKYQNMTVWSAKETATYNTQKILDWCDANSYESTACSHCRSKSFVIGGTTYYGQLVNMSELADIFKHRAEIDSADTSASSYSSLVIPTQAATHSSNQYSATYNWYFYKGTVTNSSKSSTRFIIPVLELPNA